MSKSMYYNWRTIDGYHCPVRVVIGPRGVGKTFKKVYDSMRAFCDDNTDRFVYVVSTSDDVKTLSQDKGARFFDSIKQYLEDNKSSSKHKQRYYDYIFGEDNSGIDEGNIDELSSLTQKVTGGTIKIQGVTAGYLISINSYGNLKRNNFINIKNIIIDEFIPEEIDIRHLKIAKKVVSVIQTVARLQNVNIYMLGNSIRLDDILLLKLGLGNMKKGEIRVIKDKYGPLIVGHYVDPNEYSQFRAESDKSVAGRLATLLGEDNLDKNEFKNALTDDMLIPDPAKRSHLLFCLHGEAGSIRINVTKDYGDYYILEDYGHNKSNRYCFDEKYTNNIIQFRPEWREVLMIKFTTGHIRFESSVIYMLFKSLLKLDLNS